MGVVADSILYAPIKFSKDTNNIDPRYFRDNEDGTYTPTPLFVHNLARDAVNYFKKRIFDIDAGNEYHTASVRQVKDTWSQKIHDDQWKALYGDKIKEANKRWYAYRNAYPDEFETRFKRVAIGGEDEARFFAGYSPDIKTGLTSTVQLYNASRELLARFAKPDKDGVAGPEYNSLPFEEPLYSKEAFAEKHKAFRSNLSIELGIPNDDFEVGKVEKMVCRINNKKCDKAGIDDTELEEYFNGLVSYITSSNAIEFKAKREEMLKVINDNFVVEFNDTTKDLHAEVIDHEITIYTKPSDGESAIKIITINREDPEEECYKYIFSVTTDTENLRYAKNIIIKSDLVKALETTIDMIREVKELSKYVDDIKRTIENL